MKVVLISSHYLGVLYLQKLLAAGDDVAAAVALLAIPKNGCVNTHPTGLPRYRGLSPYFTHLLFGDEQNTITIHWLDEGIDTGDIIAQASVPILETDTGFTTGHKVTEAGRDAFREVWPLIKSGKAPRRRQDEREACTFNFSWDLAQIDWNRPARDVWNLVRALTRPLAGSWTLLLGRKLLVWSARMVAEEGGRRSCSSPAPCASSWADNRNRGG